MLHFRLALAGALVAAPLFPQASAQQRPAAARAWQEDWGQHVCALVRKPDEGRPFATAFVTAPGSVAMRIMLVTTAGTPLLEGVDNVVLLPAGTAFPVTTDREAQVQRPRSRNHYGLPQDFRDRLAEATELQLRTGERIRARVPLDGVRGALASHRRCLGEVAREWGLDEAALAALSRRPESTNILGLRPTDYPAEAVRRATQGMVTLRITVSAGGRALDCLPVASSGSPEIDSTACRVALARARFTPALDAQGRPVAARAAFTASFALPQ